MVKFTVEERNLICIYNTGSRELLLELTQMKTPLKQDKMEFLKLIQSVMDEITAMSDGEFYSIISELIAGFN